MAVLPRYLAGTPPPRESGLARASDIGALTRTGDIEVWRGVSRVGGAMQYAGRLGAAALRERKSLDDTIRWGTATQKTEEGFFELEDAAENTDFTVDIPLPDSPDYNKTLLEISVEKKEKLINDALRDADKRAREIRQGFPTTEGKEKYKLWYAERRLAAEKNLGHIYGVKHDSYQRARLDKLWQDAARYGDTETANSYIDKMDANELITPERAAAYKKQAIEIAEQEEILLAINYAGATLLDEDIKNASDTIEKSKVFATEAEKAQFRNQLKSVLNNRRAHLKEHREQEINAEQGRLMQLARKGQLDDEIIRTSRLDEFGTGSKKTFYDMLDARNKAVLEGKEDLFKKSDPVVLADILEQVRDPESDIAPKDISSLVGKPEGLSIADADRLISRLDVFKGFWFKQGDRYLKDQLGWSGADVKFMHPEGALAYHLATDELFTAIEKENLKDKDIYERAKEIAVPHIVDYWEKALFFKEPKIKRLKALLAGEKESKTKTETKKKPARKGIDPEGIW